MNIKHSTVINMLALYRNPSEENFLVLYLVLCARASLWSMLVCFFDLAFQLNIEHRCESELLHFFSHRPCMEQDFISDYFN